MQYLRIYGIHKKKKNFERTKLAVTPWRAQLRIFIFRACLHGGGGPQVGEVTRPHVHIISYFISTHMIGEWTRLGGLPGLPGKVTLSAGVTICHVNVSRWGNPPSRGRVHGKKLKSETRMF